ncbi:hypothetical protein DLAC_07806 [Tieghemostelium lacteum]|uniref:F-box domain-containing protein n=1 Tax=Tieghemostelium lacteum TaxID=361077 RepID=A0A151ZAG6_TIELA|nr:hypothetical protein DLAC_07806 [Tieghemostelium lacteum]|eukprot:KYQ90930.1 hypothetical protein DLAC_07806 [Tieghemostelium lacteum]
MNHKTLPNYVFVEILNYLARAINNRMVQYKLIEKISLVSKEWRFKILPRINFSHVFFYITNNKRIEELQALLNRGVRSAFIRINPRAEMKSVEPLHLKHFQNLKLPKNFNASRVDIIAYFGDTTITTPHIFIKEILDIFKKIDVLDLENYNSTTQNLSPNFFGDIRKLEFTNCCITAQDVNDIIEKTKCISLVLRSTPSYSIITDDSKQYLMDDIYKYCETNKTMESLSVYNFYWRGSFGVGLSLINNNTTLTELNLTNLHGDIPNIKINNNTIKKFYYDNRTSLQFIRRWDSPSALQSINFGLLEEQDIALVGRNFRSLNSVSVCGDTPVDVIIDLIRLNNPFERFHIDTGDNINFKNHNELVNALLQNNKLKYLHFSITLPPDALCAFIKSQHPTIRSLKANIESSTLVQATEVLKYNTTLEKLEFTFEKDSTSERQTIVMDTVIEIIKHNLNLVSLDCLYFDAELQNSQLDQLIQFIDLNPYLIRFSIYKNNKIPKVLQTFLANKLIDF